MAKLTILEFPDPRLRTKAAPVAVFDAALKQLSEDMLETMYAAPGIGLAAPQVGVGKRVLVLDVAREGEPKNPMKLVNPAIVWVSDDDNTYEEGCLSVPEHYAEVARPRAVSTTMMRRATPTWGAARPMPGAAYMVSSMSSMSRRTSSSTWSTGFALSFRRGSGAVMIGSRAMSRIAAKSLTSGL